MGPITPNDEEWEFDEQAEDDEDFDCGETDDGYCQYAGSEWCDFECPFRS